MSDADRPRGILTPADRRFLRGDVTLGSDQSRYDAHYRIRRRLRNAILDAPILLEDLPERDVDQVFDAEDEALADAVVDAIAGLYLGADALEANPRRVVEAGVERAERLRDGEDGELLDVSLSVDAADDDRVDHIGECLREERLHALDDRDLRAMARLLAGREDLRLAED